MARSLALALGLAATLAASAVAATNAFPARIDLPDGFQPEGIAIAGQQFYVGSIPTGVVYSGRSASLPICAQGASCADSRTRASTSRRRSHATGAACTW